MRKVLTRTAALRAVVLLLACLALLSVWPARIWTRDLPISAGSEAREESRRITDGHNVKQFFTAAYDHLDSVDVWVRKVNHGRYMEVRILDEGWNVLYRCYVDLDGANDEYVSLPIGLPLEVGENYFLVLDGARSTYRLQYRGNILDADTGDPTIGPVYYHESTVDNFHLDCVFHYRQPIAKLPSLLLLAGICVLTLCLWWLIGFLGKKRQGEAPLITVRQLIRYVCTPLVAAAGLILLIMIIPLQLFGYRLPDILLLSVGVMITVAFLLYALWRPSVTEADASRRGFSLRQVLMMAAFAWIIAACCEYMNAFFTIYQTLAERREVIGLLVFLLLTLSGRELLRVSNLVVAVVTAVIGAVWRHGRLLAETEKEYDLHNTASLYAVIIAVLSAVLLWNFILWLMHTLGPGRKARTVYILPNLCGILALLFAITGVVFSNGRYWGLVLGIAAAMAVWRFEVSTLRPGSTSRRKRRDDWLCVIAGGCVLHFIYAMGWSLLYRRFPAFYTGRFPFIFHTVTVTAEYLSIMEAVATVLLLRGLMRLPAQSSLRERFRAVYRELVFFGVVSSYLLFTMSRTGFLACAVMVLLILLSGVVVAGRKAGRLMGRLVLMMLCAVLLCFPATYSMQRIIPAMTGRPQWFMTETQNVELKGDVSWDNPRYMNVQRLVTLFGIKVFGMDMPSYDYPQDRYNYTAEGDPIYGVGGVLLTPEQSRAHITELDDLLESGESTEKMKKIVRRTRDQEDPLKETEEAAVDEETTTEEIPVSQEESSESLQLALDAGSFFNGRLVIFRAYLEQANMTGHEEMGALLPWGERALHAHNSFLQTMYDCGIPTAVCFLLLVILLLIRSAGAFRLAYRKEDSADMQLLSFALLVAFTVAGLSEWNFQFSNPMTITAMLAVVPLLTGKWKRRPVQ
ncbi:MAG: hypothetical protein IJT34_11095 [Butyrivibrio sp.]|nr:hypothetical protein [Butyrivibrio sp.]